MIIHYGEDPEPISSSNPLPVSNFYLDLVQGNVTGYSVVHKYGRNADMALSTEEAITSDGTLVLPSSASTVRIKAGGNVNDTANGTGARQITIEGSDSNGEYATETIATNGSSASSATTTSFLRVYRAYVSQSGAYLTDGLATTGTNQGNIVIEDSGGTNDLITITQYEGQSEYGAYHIPSNKTGYLLSVVVTVSSVKESDIIMYTRDNATNTTAPVSAKRLKLYLDGVVGEAIFNPKTPLLIGSDCDIWFTGISTNNGTEVSVDFEILLIDN